MSDVHLTESPTPPAAKPQTVHALFGAYLTGFTLSVLLTLAAYTSLTNQSPGSLTTGIIIGLAVVQFLVQLVFFMHLGRGRSARLNLVIFSFMLIVIGIVVIGSLWIMENLDYNMMPTDMDEYMIEQVNKGF